MFNVGADAAASCVWVGVAAPAMWGNRLHGLQLGGITFAVAFLVAVGLTPVVRSLARRWRLLDAVGSARKVHAVPTPRVGGVAILVALLVAVGSVLSADGGLRELAGAHLRLVLTFLAGAVVMALTGLVDDVRGLQARYKLAVELAIAGALCVAGFAVEDVALPGGVTVHLGAAGVPLTMLWMAGVMNATNLIDGLDGLAGGVSGIALAGIFVFSITLGQPVVGVHAAALAGALAGFLVYNFHPATVFMGDTGSLLVGYCLSVLTVLAARVPGGTAVEPWFPVLLVGVPLVDMVLAITRRALRGRPLFSPDRDHLHHRLLARGLTQRQAVLVLYAAATLFCTTAVVVRAGSPLAELSAMLLLVAAVGAGLWRLGMLDVRVGALLAERRRNIALRARLQRAAAHLRRGQEPSALTESARLLAAAVGAEHARLRLAGHASERAPEPSGAPPVRFPLNDGRAWIGDLELTFAGRHLDRDETLAVEQVCEELARAAGQLRGRLLVTAREGRPVSAPTAYVRQSGR